MSLWWLWLVGSAAAQDEVLLDVHLHGAWDLPPAQSTPAPLLGGGLGVGAAVPIMGPLWFQSRVSVARLVGAGSRVEVAAGLRLFPWPRDVRRLHPSVVLEAGIDVRPSAPSAQQMVYPSVLGGLGLDVDLSDAFDLRLQVGWMSPTAAPGGLHGEVGLVWSLGTRKAGPDDRVWLPYPRCEWASEEQARRRIEASEMTSRATLDDEVSMPVASEAPEGEALVEVETPPTELVALQSETPEEPELGGLFILVTPGDIVELADGTRIPISPGDRVQPITHSGGRLDFAVFGGGLREEVRVNILGGEGVWRRLLPDGPREHEIYFALDSSELSPLQKERLRNIAAWSGRWSWEVVGHHSVEGAAERNQRLASARATAVKEFLIREGVAPDRITALSSTPLLDRPTDDQRFVRLVATPPSEVP